MPKNIFLFKALVSDDDIASLLLRDDKTSNSFCFYSKSIISDMNDKINSLFTSVNLPQDYTGMPQSNMNDLHIAKRSSR